MTRAAAHPGTRREHLEGHFQDLEHQLHAARLGMWVFLASEVLFFAGLFALYAAYRGTFPEVFKQGAGHTDLMLGTVNTYILVTASFLVALAVGAIRKDRARIAALELLVAAGLGAIFLTLKGIEYWHHFREGLYPGRYLGSEAMHGPGAMAFWTLYYLMTGLHFVHVTGGVALLSWLAVRARRGAYDRTWHTPLELGGMYWHFVDMVWLFLWPMFYLMR